MKLLTFVITLSLLSACDFWRSKGGHDVKATAFEEPLEVSNTKRTIASSAEGARLYKEYDADIASGRCNEEIQRRINLYRAERSWVKGPTEMDGSSTYLSPTSILGRWVSVRKFKSGELKFSVLTKHKIEHYNYSATCSFTKDVRPRSYARLENSDGGPMFTDEDLVKLIEHTTNYGVIYVWSPGMGYSYGRNIDPRGAYEQLDDSNNATSGVKNAKTAAMDVAKKMNLTMSVTVLVDPFVHRSRVEEAFRAGNHDLEDSMLRRMASFELLMRSMGQHYPSLLVYGNGKIFRQMQPGLSTTNSYREFIEEAVKALKTE
jgi:hypothetical protein